MEYFMDFILKIWIGFVLCLFMLETIVFCTRDATAIKTNTVSHYKNCIVIDKYDNGFVLDSCGTRIKVKATEYELALRQPGDTIK